MRLSREWAVAMVVAVLLLFNLFWNISTQPVAAWDEARHVASGLEMVSRGDFLVNHFEGEPDYWNAKPPLSFWAVALGYKLLANPYVGVRLISLLSALLTVLLVFYWVRRYQGEVGALLAALLLATTPSIVLSHGMRTADADMLFVLLVTLAMWCATSAITHLLALAYLFLGLAFLAKSFHVVPYGASLLLYSGWLWRRGALRVGQVIASPMAFLVPVLPWVVARYEFDGMRFFDVMFFNDVVKRSLQVIESHEGPWWYYLRVLLSAYAIPLICAALVLRRQAPRAFLKEPHGVLLVIWITVPLTLYSLASSKLSWYVYPVFPAIAILMGMALGNARAALGARGLGVVMVLLLIGIVSNEARIARSLLWPRQDPVQNALISVSSIHPGELYLFMDTEAGVWRQDYYAVSQLHGNLRLMKGGRSAFDHALTPSVLIDPAGAIKDKSPLP